MIEWTIEDGHAARGQGWMIRLGQRSDHWQRAIYPIIIWTYQPGRRSKKKAVNYVAKLADKGDPLASKAIAYMVQERMTQ